MKTLDQLMATVSQEGRADNPDPAGLDLLLYSPCPVKLAVKEKLDAIVRASEAAGDPLKIHIPMGCTSVDPYDPLHLETDPARLPAIIASIGFGDFFRKGFRERFIDTGLFEAVPPKRVTPLHERAGVVDPEGRYTVYALTPYIFMVDLDRLGDVPPPRRWEDLLDPRYKGQINMCGDGDDMADAVLMSICQSFGMEGIGRLAANSHGLMHSSRMGKSGGSARGGGIYILPYFFAETSRQPDNIRVIWPEDGTAASPIYFLARPDARPRIDPLLTSSRAASARFRAAAGSCPWAGRCPIPCRPARRSSGWGGTSSASGTSPPCGTS
ncbi:ABC transporter substrate-binding protein [Pseudodesulfovibrio sp.]|uniref:ABC transporter substrate-binding protein n=1 Tax=Pseudodesulfovibrio sp. TaxID=2035812 RepID=UPI0026039319|nr:ABC transporter substrate-binding protein [Pseudodesulfovibrio sp.]MDD3311413.1 ABC transporter substrate-binding protein [Pseudodesulfovibrio sp.]